jgi:hypothetical protein
MAASDANRFTRLVRLFARFELDNRAHHAATL